MWKMNHQSTLRTFQRLRFAQSSVVAPISSSIININHHPISSRRVHISSSYNSGPGSSKRNCNTSNTHKLKYRRPPGGSTTLPTIDASPILSPNVYIKKTSKASHSIAGPDATKRLLVAQHKICSWIWNQIGLLNLSQEEEEEDGHVRRLKEHEKEEFDERAKDNDDDDDDGNLEEEHQYHEHIGFMLVGHGVPYQLLQDHVDCAWQVLNNTSSHGSSGSGAGALDDGEVVECNFYNDQGKPSFDWIKLRKRDNTISKKPHSYISSCDQSQLLYLTVMNRLATTFGTILQTQPPPDYPTINTDRYWKRDISIPISHWRATFKRGYVYPPSATHGSYVNAFDSCDERGGKGREFWTGPPIVELVPVPKADSDALGPMGEENSVDVDVDANVGIQKSDVSFVRVTLQGIPSVFWKEEGCDSDNVKDDMVPLSLVFEACFEPEKKAS